MPFDNLNSRHFLATEQTAIEDSLTELETAIMPKLENLTPDERQKYGSVNEQNKLIVNKVRDFRNADPSLSNPEIDWEEFAADFQSREFIQGVINRLQKMVDGLGYNKIRHDYDNYHASLADYSYSKYKASTMAPGYENKVNELGQFFPRTPAKPEGSN